MSSTTTTSSQDQADRVWGTRHRRTIRVAGSPGERGSGTDARPW